MARSIDHLKIAGLCMSEIFRATTDISEVTARVLRSPIRVNTVVAWRQAVILVAYAQGRWSLTQIGKMIDRDHTTVMHALVRAGVLTGNRRQQRYPKRLHLHDKAAAIVDRVRDMRLGIAVERPASVPNLTSGGETEVWDGIPTGSEKNPPEVKNGVFVDVTGIVTPKDGEPPARPRAPGTPSYGADIGMSLTEQAALRAQDNAFRRAMAAANEEVMA